MPVGAISPSWRHVVYKFFGVLTSVLASLVWLATITALFGLWAADGFVQYQPGEGDIVYISNVGAEYKTIFIVGAALTGVFFVLTLIFTKLCFDSETRRRFKKGVSITSIIFGILASVSLLLLSIFDSNNYTALHYTFTGLFITCTLISGIFSTIYRFSRNELNLAVYIRVLFVSVVIPLAICFVIFSVIPRPSDQTQLESVAASFEWTIAILFVLYLALFALDLILSG
ncbi:unnamed protein product [Adineta steineri]|uniref:CWH43-like N-terminal domain-containing protein n=1 Tax=Adineta steineri TaxID=433720 RepID=A0A818JIE3_9BILA|nr:unnamed protein product [Adineta steineri]CAF3540735.1 unnamed protein product [Adineta steineri]